jgi:uncharacterized membrane protein YeaQ/YmgE (transglycosylase-associated protein family)
MSLIAYILVSALVGLFVGALARLILPGRDPMTIVQTILVGMGGSLLASLVAYALGDRNGAGFLLSLVFAVLIVWLVRKARGHSDHGHHQVRTR